MTAEEFAIRNLEGQPYFEALVRHIAKKATRYSYAMKVHSKTLGVGTSVDYIMRDETLRTLGKLENVRL